jgi:hypothetical protein
MVEPTQPFIDKGQSQNVSYGQPVYGQQPQQEYYGQPQQQVYGQPP